MSEAPHVVYTAKIRTRGGRDTGALRSSDGCLDVMLSNPGSARIGTNAAQLLAAGWSAGLETAIAAAARRRNVALHTDMIIDTEIDLNVADAGDQYFTARFNISLPGIDGAVARALIDEAHAACPCSRATRGNIAVTLSLVETSSTPAGER